MGHEFGAAKLGASGVGGLMRLQLPKGLTAAGGSAFKDGLVMWLVSSY